MNTKRMGQLLQITATIRERELAALAALMAQHKKLAETERSATQAMREARLAGMDGLCNARQAEIFARWTAGVQSEIAQKQSQLSPVIDAQKQRAATAVGRHETLGAMDQRLASARKKETERQKNQT